MHHDAHDSGAEAAGAASWLVAMVLFIVLAVAVIVALFAWAPWDDDTAGTDSNNPGIDVNVDDNTQPGGQEPQPQQSP
jgi:hypothetical protein